jgi:uncharacterized protein YhfF
LSAAVSIGHAADFWRVARRAVPGLPAEGPYQVWHFGDSDALAHELAELVLLGVKRATTGLLWDAEADPSAMPVEDGYSIVTERSGVPRLIIRTTDFEVRPFRAVDAEFAAAEGEGDKSLDYWRAAHWRYFTRRCEALGRVASEAMPVILERFQLIYPRTT